MSGIIQNTGASAAIQAQLDSLQTQVTAASFVSDVIYAASLATFPVTGAADTLYIAEDTSISYWWDGAAYKPSGIPAPNFATANLTSTGTRTHTFNHALTIQGTGVKTVKSNNGPLSAALTVDYFYGSTGLVVSSSSTTQSGSVSVTLTSANIGSGQTSTGASAHYQFNATGGATRYSQATTGNRWSEALTFQGTNVTLTGTAIAREGINGSYGTAGQVKMSGGNAASWHWATLTAADISGSAAVTVVALPSAVTVGANARRFVSDATVTHAAGVGTVVVGGGANAVPVYSDGLVWRVG